MIDWEAAYAAEYAVLVSADGEQWESVAKGSAEAAMMAKITLRAEAPFRFIKLQFDRRATIWGFSIWEVGFFFER